MKMRGEKFMWYEITSDKELQLFLREIWFFHDSCIKGLTYISGAYVNDDLSMHPINDVRRLSMLLQRQNSNLSTIELEFSGLNYLKLYPVDEAYTCEILDAAMFFRNGWIYWCDDGDVSEEELDDYEGTLICASKCRWRPVDENAGTA